MGTLTPHRTSQIDPPGPPPPSPGSPSYFSFQKRRLILSSLELGRALLGRYGGALRQGPLGPGAARRKGNLRRAAVGKSGPGRLAFHTLTFLSFYFKYLARAWPRPARPAARRPPPAPTRSRSRRKGRPAWRGPPAGEGGEGGSVPSFNPN